MPRPARVLVLVSFALVVLLVVVWSLQRRLTYFPAGAPPSIETLLPGGEEVVLATSDGLDLDAWWLASGPTAVVVLPGNAGNRAGRVGLASALHGLGTSVLLVDYRGYGGNPGSPSEAGLVFDGHAAVDWVEARADVDDVVLYGESLGSAVALAVAVERRPAAVILRSPFPSLVDVARAHYGPVPAWLLRDPFRADQAVAALTSPLLVMATERDEIVPVALSRRLFDAAPPPKRLRIVDADGHNDPDLLDGDEVVEAMRDFLEDLQLIPPA